MFIQAAAANPKPLCPSCGKPLPGLGEACPACLMALAGAFGAGGGSGSFFIEPDPTQAWPGTNHGPAAAQPSAPYRVGPYELVAEIARGGMGIVFEAWHSGLRRKVALKVIEHSVATQPGVRARFRTEAEAAARLEHPHIVRVYEVGEEAGLAYIAMQLIEGEPLQAHLRRPAFHVPALPDALSRRQAAEAQCNSARLMATVARAVQFAHDRGVLHRDLKPGNILLDDHGQPHLVDFGLARLADSFERVTLPVTALGSPGYMAPEQARAGAYELTTAGDIFSLGAILYEMLTGEPAFGTGAALDILVRSATQAVKPPRALNPNISPDLEAITLRCLEREPERRYASAAALAQDLENTVAGRPIVARPLGSFEKSLRWITSHPLLAMLTAALALVTLAGIAGVFWQWRQATAHLAQAQAEAARAQAFAAAANAQAYSADMNLASFSLLNDNIVHTRRLLLAHGSEASDAGELRSWEWYALAHLCRPLAEPLGQLTSSRSGHLHGHPSARVFFSSGSQENRVHSLPSAKATAVLHGSQVLAVSPDGEHYISLASDGCLSLWSSDEPTAKPKRLLFPVFTSNSVHVEALAYTPDGSQVLALLRPQSSPRPGEIISAPLHIAAWTLADAHLAWERCVAPATAVAHVSPVPLAIAHHEPLVAVPGPTGQCLLLHTATGEQLGTLSTEAAQITALAFRPIDDHLAIGTRETASILLFRLTAQSQQLTERLTQHRTAVTALAFTPDAQTLASGSADHTIRLWRLSSSGQYAHATTLREHSGTIASLLWDETTHDLYSLSDDGSLLAWRGAGSGQLDQTRFPPAIALAASAEHDLVAFLEGGSLHLWHKGERRAAIAPVELPADLQPLIAVSPDGEQIVTVTADGQLQWRRAANGRLSATTQLKTTAIDDLDFTDDGQQLILLTRNREVITVDSLSHQQLSQHRLTAPASAKPTAQAASLAPQQPQRLLLTLGIAHSGASAPVFDLRSGNVRSWPNEVADSPRDLMATDRWGRRLVLSTLDGHLVSFSGSNLSLERFCWPERERGSAIAVSPDGTRIALANVGSSTLTLWAAPSMTQVATLRCDLGQITQLSFAHHEGSLLITGQQGTLLLQAPRNADEAALRLVSD